MPFLAHVSHIRHIRKIDGRQGMSPPERLLEVHRNFCGEWVDMADALLDERRELTEMGSQIVLVRV